MTEQKPTTLERSCREMRYSIEWLGEEEFEKLREHSATAAIDVEALQGEYTYEVDERNCLLLAAGGTVVRILSFPDSGPIGH